jgi:hypothetical protein
MLQNVANMFNNYYLYISILFEFYNNAAQTILGSSALSNCFGYLWVPLPLFPTVVQWVLHSATSQHTLAARLNQITLMSWVLSLDPPACVVYALVLTPTIKFAVPSLQLFWDSLPPMQLRRRMPRQNPWHCKRHRNVQRCPKSRVVKAGQGQIVEITSAYFRIVIGCYWQHWLFWRVATAQCGCDELSDAAYDVFKPWGTSRYKSFIGHAETTLHLDINFMSLGQSRRRKQSHHLSLAAETCKYINNIL